MPSGAGSDVNVVAVFSTVLYLLVLPRLWDAAASPPRARPGTVLRQASISLVTAADMSQVAAAVKGAVDALLRNRQR